MALPVIDNSVTMQVACKNIHKYLIESTEIEFIFRLEALRNKVNIQTAGRKSYLLYALKMYT